MISRLITLLWGDLSREELKKFGMLASIFFLIIGSYAMVRPLKDAVFMRTVGKLYLPYARIASFALLIPLLLLYAKLVDLFQKHQLFYIICSCYVALFLFISYALTSPMHGLANTTQDKWRLLGWLLFVSIETFGSLVVALFWSFVANRTNTATAKRGYPLIVVGAQVGSLLGPEMAKRASWIGVPRLVFIVACTIALIALGIRIFTALSDENYNAPEKEHHTGPIEGLRLLLKRPYLLGVLCIATFGDIVSTILEYQMMLCADDTYASIEKVIEFFSFYVQSFTIIALVFAIMGTSFFVRRFGLTFCLVMYPLATAAVVVLVWLKPLLWVLFGAMITIKGLSYALNVPCKEMLYIPASTDIKFKAKSWIDGVGSRWSKALGAGINACFVNSAHLVFFGSLVSLGIIGSWVMIAFFVGKKNEQLVRDGKIIE